MSRIFERLKGELCRERLLHVLGVVHRSIELAPLTGADTDRAVTAAYLHDIGKGRTPGDQRAQMHTWGTDVPAEDEDYPQLWHGWFAREAAWREFGVDDPLVLDAVAFHTTGRPAMTPVDAVLFLSDYLEPMRNFTPVIEARDVKRLGVNEALKRVLNDKISYVERSGRRVHPRALEARRYYQDQTP
ncbi:MAG: bis(5'-nucleosyl)-tetraphosphatase (symmetrical) YqeK [Candidatus Sumerlaeia bacterium]